MVLCKYRCVLGIYWLLNLCSCGQFNLTKIHWLEFLYFSVVTATTLGFGDIHPIGGFAQAAVIVEVLIAIGLLRLALSALWHSYHDKNYADKDLEEFMLFSTASFRHKLILELSTVFHILNPVKAQMVNFEKIGK